MRKLDLGAIYLEDSAMEAIGKMLQNVPSLLELN